MSERSHSHAPKSIERDSCLEAGPSSSLGTSPAGRLLFAALISAGVLLKPNVPSADTSRPHTTSAHRDGLRRHVASESLDNSHPHIETITTAWGITSESFLNWQKQSFPAALSRRDVLRAVRVEPRNTPPITDYFGNDADADPGNRVAGRTQPTRSGAEVYLYPQAFQPDTSNMTEAERLNVEFYHAYGEDRRFDDAIKVLYHEYIHVLLSEFDHPAKVGLTKLIQTMHGQVREGYFSEFVHHGRIRRDRLPIATDEWIGIVGEEAFQLPPTDTDAQMKQALVARLLVRTRMHGSAAQMFMTHSVDAFFELLHAAHPDFSVRQTAADRIHGVEHMRGEYRVHCVRDAIAQLDSSPELQEILQASFARTRSEWSLREQLATLSPEKIPTSDRVFVTSLLGPKEEESARTETESRHIRAEGYKFSSSEDDSVSSALINGVVRGHTEGRAFSETRDVYQVIASWDRVRAELRSLRRGLKLPDATQMDREDFSRYHRGLVSSLESFADAWRRLSSSERQKVQRTLRRLDHLYEGDDQALTQRQRHQAEQLLGHSSL